MHHPLVAVSTSWTVWALLFITIPARIAADDEIDRRATALAIEKLGGSVRRLAGSKGALEVSFQHRGHGLTDEGLAHLADLQNVVSLNLKETRITSSGLVHLKGLASLKFLHLEQTEVDDEGVAHLIGLTNLEYLNLYATNITDRSLDRLVSLKHLKHLYLWQTDVTDEGVARLEAALPALKIVRGVDLSKLPKSYESEPKRALPTAALKWVAVTDRAEAPQRSENGINVQVFFVNRSKRPVKVVWIAYDGELKLYAELAPGATRQQNTYSRNTWLITDENDKSLGYFLVTSEEALAVIPRQD